MLASYGGLDKLKTLKNRLRKENGLGEVDESSKLIYYILLYIFFNNV